ncbi:MAG: hypothetical protein FWG98_05400 [Candidatus Cloacimonetes bacterium]|nr:hypothetical protein [Candidatus Cloacimonadota bacterium]
MTKITMKNQVILENNLIKKIFINEQDFYTEYHFYKEYGEFDYIPKLINVKKQTLYLENIEGKSLYQITPDKQLLLAKTLGEFHNLSSIEFTHREENNDKDISGINTLVHNDTNLNNYIYSAVSTKSESDHAHSALLSQIKSNDSEPLEDKIFMFDFTEISFDHPLCDVYSVLLFFCETHLPNIFTDFLINFYELYFNTIKFDLKHSKEILKKEILKFENRREKYGKCIYNYHYFLKNKDTMLKFY